MTAYARGLAAENLALWWLRLRGYTILQHRYKTVYGEIDIVALRQSTLVFAEVKQRANMLEGAYAITPRTQQRIINTANYFLAQYAICAQEMRFDALLLDGARLWHLPNAWQVG